MALKLDQNKIKRRIPVLLSAFVCPGVGQFVQARWVSGALFSSGFIIGFCWFMVLALRIIIDFYKLAFEFETHKPNPIEPASFIAPVAIVIIFYFGSLFDVVAAQQRLARKERDKLLL